jgi:4-amino-4-deoxy-L-arabinose transferase-like glycosyltransferase
MRRDLPVYLGLLLVLFIVRFPSFFFTVFDWDESTMIVMGQSILNGYLPYVHAWDIKPPLAFYAYALFIALFGKSIISVRLGGILCIYIACIFTYETAKKVRGRTAGMISALFLSVFVSTGPSGLSTMTEHILLVPVSFILYLLMTRNMNKKAAFITGLVLGIGILTKSNMVFESLAVLVLLSSGILNKDVKFLDRIKECLTFVIGISIPVLAMTYYYFMNDSLLLFLKTNVTAVLDYSGMKEAVLADKIGVFLYNIEFNMKTNPLLWASFSLGIIYLLFIRRGNNKFIAVAMIIFTGQMSSLFLSGKPFGGHYLLESMPVASLVSGVAISESLSEKRIPGVSTPLIIILITTGVLFSLFPNVIKNYAEIYSRLLRKQPLYNDSCYNIAEYLRRFNVKGQYIYMVNSCQIVYWLTDSRYPTKYIHPSNIFLNEYMLKIIDGSDATREKELLSILDKRPRFIIFRRDLWPKYLGDFKAILDNELSANYEHVKSIDTYQLYKRKNSEWKLHQSDPSF